MWYSTKHRGAYQVLTKSLLSVLERPAAVVRVGGPHACSGNISQLPQASGTTLVAPEGTVPPTVPESRENAPNHQQTSTNVNKHQQKSSGAQTITALRCAFPVGVGPVRSPSLGRVFKDPAQRL